jgi:beta-glucosidase
MDLATEPRWKRISGTFGEDPALSMDMARAVINGWQSTYDENGNDLGWGENSVNNQMKHFPGDGAAEGGRESHTRDGAYNVFPRRSVLHPPAAIRRMYGASGQDREGFSSNDELFRWH